MVQPSQINEYVTRIAREFRPNRIILFGSYAYGKPTESSDVDLLVVMNHRRRKNVHQAVDIDLRLQRTFPLDLIVRRPAEVKRRIGMSDSFMKTIVEQGTVLYERGA
jgi:predicted nucleotidyltransferase